MQLLHSVLGQDLVYVAYASINHAWARYKATVPSVSTTLVYRGKHIRQRKVAKLYKREARPSECLKCLLENNLFTDYLNNVSVEPGCLSNRRFDEPLQFKKLVWWPCFHCFVLEWCNFVIRTMIEESTVITQSFYLMCPVVGYWSKKLHDRY